MDQVEISVPEPQKIPSGEDWARYKELITTMYLDADMKLKDLMKVMEDDYCFKATFQMYKKRLKTWRIRKNLKEDEKEELLAQMEAMTPEERQHFPHRGRPVEHRVIRYRQKRLKISNRKQTVSDKQSKPLLSSFPALYCEHRLPALHPEAPRHLVSLLRDSLLEELATRRKDGTIVFRGEPFEVAYKEVASNLRCGSYAGATESLGRINDEVKKLPRGAYAWFAGLVCIVTHEPGWLRFPEYRTSMMSFFYHWYIRQLGPCHPLTSSLMIMYDTEVARTASPILRCFARSIDRQSHDGVTIRNGLTETDHEIFR